MRALRSFYNIGIYKLEWADKWPWHYENENGVYLSRKGRRCKWAKAAEFTNPSEARAFFQAWKSKRLYKMELIEFKKYVEVPDPILPPDNPHSILKKIYKNEHSYVRTTATFWFSGQNISELWSEKTLGKHRERLLEYGIDISMPPAQKWEPLPSQDDEVWHLSPPDLAVV